MSKYSQNQMKLRREAIKRYDEKIDRISCRFPAGTKERIEKTGKSGNAFIKECVLAELDRLEAEENN